MVRVDGDTHFIRQYLHQRTILQVIGRHHFALKNKAQPHTRCFKAHVGAIETEAEVEPRPVDIVPGEPFFPVHQGAG
jgi:hypothetical protein